MEFGPVAPLDHFLGYQVKRSKRSPRFRPVKVHLEDQFQEGDFQVRKLVALLNPVVKDPTSPPSVVFPLGITDLLTHLESYQIRGRQKRVRRAVLVENQFGQLVLDVGKADRLLVPASKSHTDPLPPPNPTTHNVDHFLCYTVKVHEGDSDSDSDSDSGSDSDSDSDGDSDRNRFRTVFVEDQFRQPKSLDVKRPRRLCNPAIKNFEQP